VARPVLDSSAKLDALERLIGELRIGHADALAVGDGANDLPMIQSAGLGVAYHAKPLVAAAAKARIDHGDLTALLYLQGYRQQDFVSS
jgi:phosphoserine phosphatase